MKSETLDLEIIIKELDLLKKAANIQKKIFEKGFVIACNQMNIKNG